MLEQIIGTKAKVRILRAMVRNPERAFSMEDIAREVGMSYGTVHPAVRDLARSRILLSQKVGRSRSYRVNKAHLLLPQLSALLNREADAFRDIASEFAERLEKKGLDNVILFGSSARGEVSKPGDIDLLIISSNPAMKEQLDKLTQEFLDKYDVLISPICPSRDSVKEKIAHFDEFMLRLIDEGIVLYGDDKWLKT